MPMRNRSKNRRANLYRNLGRIMPFTIPEKTIVYDMDRTLVLPTRGLRAKQRRTISAEANNDSVPVLSSTEHPN